MSSVFYTCITGASSGIGRGFALHCAKKGHPLILISRDLNKLTELKQEIATFSPDLSVVLYSHDLSVPGAGTELVKKITDDGHAVSLLINNAGRGLSGSFVNLPLTDQITMMTLNMQSLVELSYGILPQMRDRRAGKILNIASTAGFQPIPSMAVYAATKSFVLSFSNALRYECKDMGIQVSCICPGPTKTNFAQNAGLDGSLLFKFAMTVQDVVQAGYDGMMKGDRLIIPGKVNQALSRINAVTPTSRKMTIADKLVK